MKPKTLRNPKYPIRERGKSFRAILEVLHAASRQTEKDVVIWVDNYMAMKFTIDNVYQMASVYLADVKIRRALFEVTMPNGTRIIVKNINNFRDEIRGRNKRNTLFYSDVNDYESMRLLNNYMATQE